MRSVLIFFLFLLIYSLLSCDSSKDFTQYVNTFIGTGGDGHTYPGPSMPYGMVQLSPDTRLEGQAACGGYYYPDSTIIGFSHTHLNGVGEPEYRDILFMPFIGEVKLQAGKSFAPSSGYRSKFNHAAENSSPGCYSVILDDYQIKVELTVTERCGLQRYTFPQSEDAHIILDLFHPGDAVELYIKKINDTMVEGLRRSHGWAFDQYVYFVTEFSKPFANFRIAVNDSIKTDQMEAKGKNIKAVFDYKTGDGEAILIKTAISAVSIDGARKNLQKELPEWDFEAVKEKAHQKWNNELKKIEVTGGTQEQRTIFYTAMYHAALSPNIFMDVDRQYRGIDHKIHTAKDFDNYTVFSLWDTFRGLHPLMTIINPRRSSQFIRSLLAKYRDGGRLPMWPLAGNYTDDMLGYHAVSVIADAYVKGIRDYDAQEAYEAMKALSQMDRLGLKYYKKTGYLPCDRQGESVSKTLEYCYDDWCIAQMASAMHEEQDYQKYIRRAHNYENVFDASVNFMRGKTYDRQWLTPFDPFKNSAYSEGNAYQYLFVPHDSKGLMRLMGGEEIFSAWLDTLFTLPSKEKHPGMIGQYWHGNEPGHHLPYLYNYTGEAWKTQRLVHKIMSELYSAEADGLAGNEDCGQMSAWYILSALGFYPVAPGQAVYEIGAPIFEKAVIHLENGKRFEIVAKNISAQKYYIQSASLNGQPLHRSYIKHAEIVNGGKLLFEMTNKPNKVWGSSINGRPPVINGQAVTMPPYILSGDTLFTKNTTIELACDTQNSQIYYTLDNSEPDKQSQLYTAPFSVNKTSTLKMAAFNDNRLSSNIVEIKLSKAEFNPPLHKRNLKRGINYAYYEKFFVTTADFDILKPLYRGSAEKISIAAAKRPQYFGFKFNGYVNVPLKGLHTFYLKSNDGSRLFIDGRQLIENDGNHGAKEEPGTIALEAGLHSLEVRYFQCGGGKALKVSWSSERMPKREIGYSELFREGQ